MSSGYFSFKAIVSNTGYPNLYIGDNFPNIRLKPNPGVFACL